MHVVAYTLHVSAISGGTSIAMPARGSTRPEHVGSGIRHRHGGASRQQCRRPVIHAFCMAVLRDRHASRPESARRRAERSVNRRHRRRRVFRWIGTTTRPIVRNLADSDIKSAGWKRNSVRIGDEEYVHVNSKSADGLLIALWQHWQDTRDALFIAYAQQGRDLVQLHALRLLRVTQCLNELLRGWSELHAGRAMDTARVEWPVGCLSPPAEIETFVSMHYRKADHDEMRRGMSDLFESAARLGENLLPQFIAKTEGGDVSQVAADDELLSECQRELQHFEYHLDCDVLERMKPPPDRDADDEVK